MLPNNKEARDKYNACFSAKRAADFEAAIATPDAALASDMSLEPYGTLAPSNCFSLVSHPQIYFWMSEENTNQNALFVPEFVLSNDSTLEFFLLTFSIR